MRNIEKIGFVVPISRELLENERVDREWLTRWRMATLEEREQWTREAAERRATERGAAERIILTTGSLTARMGWTTEYAEHLVQPYCSCGQETDGGWWYCEHAQDLGLAGNQ